MTAPARFTHRLAVAVRPVGGFGPHTENNGDMACMVRICHVITALETGGAEHQLERVISAVPGEHRVVSLRGTGVVGQRLRAAGVDVTPLGISGALGLLSGLRHLRAEIRAGRPDVVQGWMYHGGLAASLAIWPGRTPVLWNIRHSVHDLAMEPGHTRRAIQASVRLARHPQTIVYNSRTAAGQHEHLGYPADRRVVIPNGFDLAGLRPDAARGHAFRQRFALPPDARVVGVVARYHPMKDHTGFLQAAARLVQRLPDVRFVLAGRDVDESNRTLVEAVQGYGLARNVHMLGEYADIPALCNALDVMCCPSAWGEAFPNVLGEAMACGVPCVTTDVGDSARLVGASGTTVPVRDASALANALHDMLADDERRSASGHAARERMVEHYGMAGVAETYRALWCSAAGEGDGVTAVPGASE